MRTLVYLPILLLLCVGAYCFTPVPHLKVELARPPIERFAPSVDKVLELHGYNFSFEPVFAHHNGTLFNKLSSTTLAQLMQTMKKYYPEQLQEVKGMSDAFGRHGIHVSTEYLVGWIYMHELAHIAEFKGSAGGCSAIIAKNKCTGSIFHGRNMDQSPPAVRNLTLHHTWYDENGDLLGESTDWYWFTAGFMSGMTRCTKERITMQENWRTENLSFNTIMSMITQGRMPQMFLFRTIMTKHCASPAFDFEQAIKFTLETEFASGMYVIMSSPQSAVIAPLSINGNLPLVRLGANSIFPEWYIVQTNVDPGKADVRRDAAMKYFNTVKEYNPDDCTAPASADGVLTAIATFPVRQATTIYTVIMSSTDDVFHTYGQEALGR